MSRVRRISLTVALVAATAVALPVATPWAQAPLAVTGTVTDGSGHGWPLYARVEVAGQTVHTDPETGRYSVQFAADGTYDFAVTALAGGYPVAHRTATVKPGDTVQDFELPVAPTCTAPGYAVNSGPPILEESFDGGLPTGWTVPFTGFGGWTFDDRGGRGNLTGGAGGFAVLDSDEFGSGTSEDASLITPPVDLSAAAAPELSFNSDYRALAGSSTADVDIKLDAAAQFATILHQGDADRRGPRVETIPIGEGIGGRAVTIRFRYQGSWDWWWQVDNVKIVDRCTRLPGGLVVGTVSDRATGRAIDGAIVAGPQGVAVTTVPTPDDPALGDGFYAVLSPLTGHRAFTATADRHLGATRDVDVVAGGVVRQDFALDAVASEPPASPQPPTADPAVKAWIALERGAPLGGLAVTPQDAVAVRQDGSVRMLFDGSAAGLPRGVAIDALAVTRDGLVLSFTKPARLPGIAGRVDDSDLVRFAAGAFTLLFDGGDVGLRSAAEDVDAVEVLADGRVVVSTVGSARVGRQRAQDEDLLALTPRRLGARTAGRWRPFLDGSDVALSGRSEDVDAAAVDATGAIDLSVRGSLGVPGLHAADHDVAMFLPTHLGRRTEGRFAPEPLFAGASLGLRSDDVTALDVPG